MRIGTRSGWARRLHPIGRWVLVAAVVAWPAVGALAEETTPRPATDDTRLSTYSSVQVLAIDVIGRTLVIRNGRGAEQRVELDDNLSGVGNVEVGDRVILGLRSGPGTTRVSSIFRSRPAASAPKLVRASPVPSTVQIEGPSPVWRDQFGSQVAVLALQADRVDRVWSEFARACDFQAGEAREGAREWFAVWEGSLRADLSGGFCRDLFNQVVDLGEPIKNGMTVAEDAVRQVLLPGVIREIQRHYLLDWDGWALAPPDKQEP